MDTVWNTIISITQGFTLWVDSDLAHPVALRFLCHDMNLETSQNVFVGPYLIGESRKQFEVDYNFFNVGLMKLPIDFSGCAFRNARLAVSRLALTLAACEEESKAKMQSAAEPTCLIDLWMQDTIQEIVAVVDAGEPQLPSTTSSEIGGYIFDFLFTAQDTSTSSLLWAVTLLDSHPEVLDRARKEVVRIWLSKSDAPISAEQLKEIGGYS